MNRLNIFLVYAIAATLLGNVSSLFAQDTLRFPKARLIAINNAQMANFYLTSLVFHAPKAGRLEIRSVLLFPSQERIAVLGRGACVCKGKRIDFELIPLCTKEATRDMPGWKSEWHLLNQIGTYSGSDSSRVELLPLQDWAIAKPPGADTPYGYNEIVLYKDQLFRLRAVGYSKSINLHHPIDRCCSCIDRNI